MLVQNEVERGVKQIEGLLEPMKRLQMVLHQLKKLMHLRVLVLKKQMLIKKVLLEKLLLKK